ncbi:DUF5590 domain-containing protein [Lacticaseibacillus thailandensis]|uniref:Cell wall elongation regulator TseB-like domain-containing protein n=1 Tax=Lacticaseibacillus thailandensis DSM 22698 = JCM 13996 TaxID=1423810 RepID=A0A0R2CK30_9LACO|nr:DUF5590 domain-containing protein [Lacticaseibacillus thailandensis]KRM88115.1 hypothetical protein FD19_GL000404 [Lacticaseibacillus thailandensis DSM 22698 = JCM 13996]
MHNRSSERWRRWALVAGIIVVVLSVIIFFQQAMHPYNKLRSQAESIATRSAQVTHIDGFWWNTRDQSYLTVAGQRNHHAVYVIIKQKNGAIHVVRQNAGTTRNQALSATWKQHDPQRVISAALRYQGKRLVWDVAYKTKQGRLGYVSYSFRTGKQVELIKNI